MSALHYSNQVGFKSVQRYDSYQASTDKAPVNVAAIDAGGAPDAALGDGELVGVAGLLRHDCATHLHQTAEVVQLHAVLYKRSEVGHRLPGNHPASAPRFLLVKRDSGGKVYI